jgi:hypothetical protein
MRAKYAGNKPDRMIHVIRNSDVSQIPRGTPVILTISVAPGNELDGMGVVLPSTAGATLSTQLQYGITTASLGPGDDGEVVMFGLAAGIVQKQTRAASTNAWPSVASVAKGIMKIDTTNNMFIAGAASDGTMFILVDDVASMASSASNSADSRVGSLNGVGRIFVRSL